MGLNEAIDAVQDAIDPEEVFKPASKEELEQRPGDPGLETYEMKIGSDKVFQLIYHNESGQTELVAKDPKYGDFTLATFLDARVDIPDGQAVLDFLQEVMQEHGEDITEG